MKKWAGGNIYSLSKNARVAFNRNRLSIPLPASSRKIRKVLQEVDPDVLHVQVPHSPFLAQKIVNVASDNVAVVGTFHILPAGRLAKLGSKSLKTAYLGGLRRFDEMVSVSQPASDFAKEYFDISSKVLPNVVDISRFRKNTQYAPSNPRIVFLGRLVARKGAAELLKAFKILHSSLPEARLVIAGDGPERRALERYVDKSGLSKAVEFLGRITEEDKPALLASADIACFPALGGESFGIVLIEAMAAGSRVVVGGDNPGYRSVLGGYSDLLIDPEDSVKFASRLKRFLTDESAVASANRWQTGAVKNYDVARIGPKIADVYRQAIAKRALEVT
jgi:phosphatidylinositol alpha-mannosyltransferase